MKVFSSPLASLLLVVVCARLVLAQAGNASITGQVKDQTGAVIPGAAVSLKNTATNVVVKTETNADGRYLIANLIPGTYTLSAEFAGFKLSDRLGPA